jgi:hypothetical protein
MSAASGVLIGLADGVNMASGCMRRNLVYGVASRKRERVVEVLSNT